MAWNVLGKGFSQASTNSRKLAKDVERLGNQSHIASGQVSGASKSIEKLTQSSSKLKKGVGGIASLVEKYGIHTIDMAKESIRGTAMMSSSAEQMRTNVRTLAKNSLEYQKTTGKSQEESMQIMAKLGHNFELAKERSLEYQSSTRTLAEHLPKSITAMPKIAANATATALGVVDGVVEHLDQGAGFLVSDVGRVITGKAKEISGVIDNVVQQAAPAAEAAMAGAFEMATDYLATHVNENLVTAEEARKRAEEAQDSFVHTMGVVEHVSRMSSDTMSNLQQGLLSTRMGLPLEEIEKITNLIGVATTDLGLNGELAATALSENYDKFLLLDENQRADFSEKLLKSAALHQQAGYEFGEYTKELLGTTGVDRIEMSAKMAAMAGTDPEEMLEMVGRAQLGNDVEAENYLQESVKKIMNNLGGEKLLEGIQAMQTGKASPEQNAQTMMQKSLVENMLAKAGMGFTGDQGLEILQGKTDASNIFGVTKGMKQKSEALAPKDISYLTPAQEETTTVSEDINRAKADANSVIFSSIEKYADELHSYLVVQETYTEIMGDIKSALGDSVSSLATIAAVLAGIGIAFDLFSGKSLTDLLPDGGMRDEAGRKATGGDAYAKAITGEMSRGDAIAQVEKELAERKAELAKEQEKWGMFQNEEILSLMQGDISNAEKYLGTLSDDDKFQSRVNAEKSRNGKGGITGVKQSFPPDIGSQIASAISENTIASIGPESKDTRNSSKMVTLTERMLFALEKQNGAPEHRGLMI